MSMNVVFWKINLPRLTGLPQASDFREDCTEFILVISLYLYWLYPYIYTGYILIFILVIFLYLYWLYPYIYTGYILIFKLVISLYLYWLYPYVYTGYILIFMNPCNYKYFFYQEKPPCNSKLSCTVHILKPFFIIFIKILNEPSAYIL